MIIEGSASFKFMNLRMLKSQHNFLGFRRPDSSWGPKERFGRLKPKKVVLRFEQSQIHYFEILRSAIIRDDDFHEFMKTTTLDFIVLGHQKFYREIATGFANSLP